ncbi:hypothetical protein Poli38472_008600 [Pythium oligandrum]|uniref:J domain-containing protein n=1 Tax=Pythium oligandrum TaxID=41045 RepID=A0A8K1FDU3_PYTOL|nr:hypothetical protein Poli38472_008600 [Pythium oligandrum]|eukprot:TMW55952.1 hypothetical protein Poli38472_008600 [Pythium oligandrum]
MEMNKGEAEKCRDIAKRFLREGKYAQAIKFFEKSHRMYPLPGVEAMCDRAKVELAKEQGGASTSSSGHASSTHPADGAGVRRRETASSSASEDPVRPYTSDQVHIVNKIRACKTHYEVLGVTKDADDNEIKKAYRKLALKLHPDKNSAPGAEDAFKAVGKAFTILSDTEKRAHYDRFGDRDPNTTPQARGRRYQEDDISPDEIFNMFFGGGFRPRRQYRQQQQHHHQQQRQHAEQQDRSMLMQLLPLLMIFLLSMLSIPTAPEVPFSMNPTAQYNVARTTQMANVAKGIPYYVERDFDRKYTNHWRDLLRVEQMVEQYHMSRLADSCENLKLKQKRMIYRARNSNSDDREAKMRAALEMKLPACEELKALRRTRNR